MLHQNVGSALPVTDSGKLYNTIRHDKYDVDEDAGSVDGISRRR